MRKTILILLCSLLSSVLYAGPVTREQARQTASQFLAAKGGSHRAPSLLTEQAPVLNAVDKAGNPYIYAFNAGNDAGYVLVSGDDRFVDVLGYSVNGSFDSSNMPDNMRAWLQGYVDEMKWAIEHHYAKIIDNYEGNAPRRSESVVKAAVEPFVLTRWNQSAPYHNLTPYYTISQNTYYYSKTFNTGYSHCATGCVATAMAQVMKYYEWPQDSTTTIPAYEWKSGVWLPDENEDLPAIMFDWTNMKNIYGGDETDETATAVAKLMQYCGYSVEMDYGKSSGSKTYLVANALKNYFDYNNETTTYVQRSFYSYANWIELIYHEIANKRPVCYGGQSSGGGHEFVIDGYQGEDFFHVNWGWGGQSDDYFKLSALNPYEQGIGGSSTDDGFHYGQDAVIGIQPSTGTGKIANVSTNTVDLSLNDNGVTFSANPEQNETVTVYIDLKNNSSDVYDGDLGIRVYYYALNEDDQQYYWYYVDDVSSDFVIPANANSETIQLTFVPDYNGTYGIKVYRPSENAGYIRYFTNNTLDGTLDVAASGSGGSETTDNVVLTLTPKIENSVLDNNTTYLHYGSIFKGTVRIQNDTNTDYKGKFLWKLLPGSFEGSFNYDVANVTVPKDSCIDIPIEEPLDMKEQYYKLCVNYIKNGGQATIKWYRYYLYPAIMAYGANGKLTVVNPTGTSYNAPDDALVVDVSGTNISNITPNELPNTLYISNQVLYGLEGKNVITYDAENNTYTAGNISLTDGYSFYSPIDFTANKVEFTYQFTVGADGSKGWNTIMLPFDVKSVTANDKEIDWFHSESDSGKNFWLKEFVSDDINTVNFNYADKMKANTPYIVAFPGNKWGDKWDMSNKTLKFIGENVKVNNNNVQSSITGSYYRFIGKTLGNNTENIYKMNEDGNAFVLGNGSTPFRAYFKAGMFDRDVTSLGIGSDTGTTDIQTLDVERGTTNDHTVYNLNGQRVAQPTKGLYIVNGKKVMIK
mgnify:CR=1 FL=1